MLNKNEIENVIFAKEGELLPINLNESFAKVPEEYTERYVLHKMNNDVLGYMGRRNCTKLTKDHINIYQNMINEPEIQNLGKYLDIVAKSEYDKGNDYILHVDILCNIGNFSHDDDNGKTEVYVHFPRTFLITKRIRGTMSISVKYGKNELEHPNSISEYFREELVKPILGV